MIYSIYFGQIGIICGKHAFFFSRKTSNRNDLDEYIISIKQESTEHQFSTGFRKSTRFPFLAHLQDLTDREEPRLDTDNYLSELVVVEPVPAKK